MRRMSVLRAMLYDLLAALLTVVGTLVALAFTVGVVEGAFEAADALEVLVGLAVGGVVALLAAGILATLATWQILRIGEAWHAALFDPSSGAEGGAGGALAAAVSDVAVGLLLALLGGLRLQQGVRLGETGFAQQGAVLLAAAIVLGFGVGLGRLVRAIRLGVTASGSAPRRSRRDKGGRREAGATGAAGAAGAAGDRDWIHFGFAYAAGLGLVLAAVVSVAVAALGGDASRSRSGHEPALGAFAEAGP